MDVEVVEKREQGDTGDGNHQNGHEDRAVGQMGHGVELGAQIDITFQDYRRQATGVFRATFHPAELLGFDAVHLRRQFGRCLHILQIDDVPVVHLGPETEVQIFGQGVGLPAACILDGLFPPDSGCTVELQKMMAGLTAHLLDGEVNIELQGLKLGEQRKIVVEMGPTGLNHPDPFVLEIGDGVFEKLRIG